MLRVMLVLLLLVASGAYADSLDTDLIDRNTYAIEILKSKQLLIVKRGDTVERRFHIALGRGGPGGKRHTGDKKTPTGSYRIMGFNDASRFYLFMRLNYPNVKDAFFGLKDQVISRREFDRIVDAIRGGALPPQNTALGGAIGIHGLGTENAKKIRIHEHLNWTEGCIALKNAEVDQLRPFVTVGTTVVIRE